MRAGDAAFRARFGALAGRFAALVAALTGRFAELFDAFFVAPPFAAVFFFAGRFAAFFVAAFFVAGGAFFTFEKYAAIGSK